MSRDLTDCLWTSIALQGAQPQYLKKHSGDLGSLTHQREMRREENKNVLLRESPGQLSMPPWSVVSTWTQSRVLSILGTSSSTSTSSSYEVWKTERVMSATSLKWVMGISPYKFLLYTVVQKSLYHILQLKNRDKILATTSPVTPSLVQQLLGQDSSVWRVL